MIGRTEINPSAVRIGGTEVNYYLVCRTKLWLFSHGLGIEQTSDRVDMGRLLHEESYARGHHKELLIDNLLRIDFDEEKGIIHEVKIGKAFEEAHKYQLLYYLFYLKERGQDGLKGILNYPRSRRTEEVVLTPESEAEVREILSGIAAIKTSDAIPPPEPCGKCRKCSYEDHCWG